jgi:hypothetical protein
MGWLASRHRCFGTLFWEHAPAAGLFAAGLLLVPIDGRPRSWSSLVVAGCCLGLAIAWRNETSIYVCAAVAAAWPVLARGHCLRDRLPDAWNELGAGADGNLQLACDRRHHRRPNAAVYRLGGGRDRERSTVHAWASCRLPRRKARIWAGSTRGRTLGTGRQSGAVRDAPVRPALADSVRTPRAGSGGLVYGDIALVTSSPTLSRGF